MPGDRMRRALAAAAWVLAAAAATASTVEDLTLERAVALASRVVIGRVVTSRPLLLASGGVVTESEIAVEETLKADGEALAALTLRHWGGVVGDVGVRVEGVPTFVAGERVLLFLVPAPGGEGWRTLGLYQGAYTIVEGDAGDEAVQAPAGGTLVVSPAGTRALPARAPLAALRSAIAAELGR